MAMYLARFLCASFFLFHLPSYNPVSSCAADGLFFLLG